MDPLKRLNEIAQRLYSDGRLTKDDIEPLFSSSDSLLLIADAEGICIAANQSWKAELGYEPQSMRGVPYVEYIHPDDLAATSAAAESLHAGKVVNFRNRYRSSDGEYRWLAWTASRYVDDRFTYAAAETIDDPEEVDALEELARARETGTASEGDA